MSKICYFYATKDDLLALTERVEFAAPIKYVRFGQTTQLPPESFKSAAQIPNIGVASHSSATGCEKFLVCDSQTIITPEKLKVLTEEDVTRSIMANKGPLKALVGLDRFAFNQLLNPDTICFTLGGLWEDEILLHGSVDTASQSKRSLALMKRFQIVLRKTFVKVKAFYVGPQALVLLKNGRRLTISAQSPKEFDLSID
jgi:hypothetical protein